MIVSTLYLVGYWSSFDINIFEYIALTDLVKFVIYPLLIGAVSLIGPTLVGISFAEKSRIQEVRQGRQVHVPEKILRPLLYVYCISVFVYTMFFDKSSFRWVMLGISLGVLFSFEAEAKSPLLNIIPNPSAHRIVFFAIAQIIIGAFFIGKYNAANIINGSKVKIVSTAIFKERGTDSFDKKGLLSGQENLKYLGSVGDQVFFLSSDNRLKYIVKSSDLHFLELK